MYCDHYKSSFNHKRFQVKWKLRYFNSSEAPNSQMTNLLFFQYDIHLFSYNLVVITKTEQIDIKERARLYGSKVLKQSMFLSLKSLNWSVLFYPLHLVVTCSHALDFRNLKIKLQYKKKFKISQDSWSTGT